MSPRVFSSLVCTTAIVSCMAASALADEIYLLPTTRATIERIATHDSLAKPSAADGSSSVVVLRDARSVQALPIIGGATVKSASPAHKHAEVAADETTAVKAADPIPPAPAAKPAEHAPETAETTAPRVVPDAVAAKIQQSATPAVTVEAPAVAPGPTAPAETATAASEPAKSDTGAAAAPSTAAPSPAAVATTPVPVEAPVTTATVAPAAPSAPPVEAAPVVTPTPQPVVVAPLVPAPAPAPVVAATPPETPKPAPVTPAPIAVTATPGLAAEAISAALKTAIEQQFVLRPVDEKKLTSEERKAAAAIVAVYAARNYAPIWTDAKGYDARALSAFDRLDRAHEDGLNDADYQVPALKGEPTAESLASAEIRLTQATLKYARQAQAGRFDPARLGELVTPKLSIPDPEAVLKTLASASDVAAALEAYNPPQDGYKRLKASLAHLDATKAPVAVSRVPGGPTIRPGEKDTRIAMLRERLGVGGATTADDANLYDPNLVEAVKTFQRTRGLKPSGLIGQQTIDAFNTAPANAEPQVADLVANMERWRWLPRDLGELHVMVNVPDFSLTVMRDGVVTHKARAIVGRVANPTPIFSETMTHIIVNPYWNVPYSIVKKEYLGKAQETKGEALTRGNFEVEVGNKTVDPTTVDWSTVNASQVHLRQRPGAGNALGNIKFMFPNQHSVYIHDTSSRGLFVQDYRSLSHGCVRVQDPFGFADALLVEEPTALTGGKLKGMIGGSEKTLWLKRPIPVHIAYFTAFVDDAGKLQSRPDLYGLNTKTKQILGL